ncbi:MAG: fatty acyl-AMP ligase [Polyangiaceae bacterium]|nr:fatty acyl-AMP ligase [Polyangiaceae bacterium]
MTTPLSRVSSPVDVRPPHDSLVAAFEAAARSRAPFVTIHTGRETIEKTAEVALDAALRWSKLLAGRGVRRGDRVMLLMPTGHAFVEAMLGTMLLGAIPVPLATPMTFGSVDRYLVNLAHIAKDCGARVTITYGRIRDAIAKDAAAKATLGDVIGEGDLDGVASTAIELPSIGGSETAFLQYTSGTTGRPKGAIITHRALVSNTFSMAHGLDLHPESDVGVSWLPLFHDMGLIGVLLMSICHPYPIHVMSPESFVMKPYRWLDLIQRVGGTITAAPNFAYDMCVARPGDTSGLHLETLRHALNGAEPIHASTVQRFRERFGPHGFRADAVMPVYGMAEATLAITFPSHQERMQVLAVDRAALERDGRVVTNASANSGGHHAVSVGRPIAGMSVAIFGEDGNVAPERTVGEVRVAGPSLMDGYFGNDEASASALSGGWLHTGDLGFVDGGQLYITGRAKELIIKGGRNIYPYDVERIAGEIDGVRTGGVAAFGRTNPVTGTEDLVVVAETSYTDAAKREAIAKAVRAELLEVLGVKADDVRFCAVGKVPRTTSGKIRRRECARLIESGALG